MVAREHALQEMALPVEPEFIVSVAEDLRRLGQDLEWASHFFSAQAEFIRRLSHDFSDQERRMCRDAKLQGDQGT